MNYNSITNNSLKYIKNNRLLFLTAVLPTFMAILYYGILASDLYTSQSKLVIRNSEQKITNGFDVMLQSTGLSSGNSDVYIVRDYIMSRDALESLNKSLRYKEIYKDSNISIFDRFNGFFIDDSFESLYKYYQNHMEIIIDPQSYILTIDVKGYNPNDAKKINEHLIKISELLVNKLNERSMQDTVGFAQKEAKAALENFKNISSKLSHYRNLKSIFDPTQQSSLQLQLVSKLQDELIATKVNLDSLVKIAPQSPQVWFLKSKVKNLETQISNETSKVIGSDQSYSGKVTEYDKLVLEKEFAAKQLAISLASLEQAKNEALKKQLYVEKVATPNLPDYPLEPYRIKNIITTFILGLILYGIISMIVNGVKEHND